MPGSDGDGTLRQSDDSTIMMRKNKPIADVAASIRARLLNIAKKVGRNFDAVLLQYFQERFLFRLSISSYNDQFILKGALVFLTESMSRFRPTKDIDLAIRFNIKNLRKIMHDIFAGNRNDIMHYFS